MNMRWLTSIVLAAALITHAGCGACRCGKTRTPPAAAGPREVELVEQALRSGYDVAIAELEKTPGPALAAVRQHPAAAGTRDALVLKIMANRLGAVDSHRRWRAQFDATGEFPGSPLGRDYAASIPALTSSRHTLFWSERLLFFREMTAFTAATHHLAAIGDAQAIETLRIAAAEPWVSGEMLLDVLNGLATLGRGRDVADGLSAHQAPDVREGERTYARSHAQSALAKLPSKARATTEEELLGALEREDLDDVKRGSYLFVLGQIASPAALPRLAALRRTVWGERMKPAFDEAIAAIAERDAGKLP